jgi:hypothetical protein
VPALSDELRTSLSVVAAAVIEMLLAIVGIDSQ